MARFAVKTLEFTKVKELLAAQCATSLGKAQALALQSEREFAAVKVLQQETAEAVRLLDEGQSFPFGGASDISVLCRQAQLGVVLTTVDLLAVANAAAAMRQLRAFLLARQEEVPLLAQYAGGMQEFPRLEKQLNNAVDEKGELRDSASVKLAGLRTGIIIAQRRVKEKLDSILHSADYQKFFQDALVTMRENRYVIPIKAEYKMNFPGIIHDQSGSGATLFIEPMAVVNLNNDIKKYTMEAKEEEERILRQLSGAVGAECGALTETLNILTRLDVISAKACLAQKQHATRPMFILDDRLEIAGGRHPLLKQDEAVPLDIRLGGDFTVLLITGPNTGGKTVALKTVGLFALMAQAGLFLPARSVKLPVFQGVYADIGDEQSIEQSLSTFSAHMTNVVSILREMGAHTLLLIDEICVGTDPNEGAALAMSLLEYIQGCGAMAIVTTHYSELKTFAYEHEKMENASVEFDPVTLQPTYRLLMGIPGSSNAFYISRRLGLPEAVLEKAKGLIGIEHARMENVLQDLEGERRTYESRNREIEELRREAEQLRNELAKKKNDLEKRRNEILHKAREEADELYRSSRRETEEIIKELRQLKKNADSKTIDRSAEKARQALSKSFVLGSKEAPEGKGLSAQNARVGAQVFLKTLGQKGVIDIINGNKVTVRVGRMKTSVPMQDCVLVAQEEKPREKPRYNSSAKMGHELFMNKVNSAVTEVDVRGKTVEEAIPYVDKAIDDCVLTGMEKFRLIHGKGTGQLRAGLTAYLRSLPSVKGLEIAAQSEGGLGATVVILK